MRGLRELQSVVRAARPGHKHHGCRGKHIAAVAGVFAVHAAVDFVVVVVVVVVVATPWRAAVVDGGGSTSLRTILERDAVVVITA